MLILGLQKMNSCLSCGKQTKVLTTRRGALYLKTISYVAWRRHECTSCGERVTTYEITGDTLASLFVMATLVDNAKDTISSILKLPLDKS